MKNLVPNLVKLHPATPFERVNATAKLSIPTTEETTTADRLLFLKDCLDKHLIDEVLFRKLRDELTYGKNVA